MPAFLRATLETNGEARERGGEGGGGGVEREVHAGLENRDKDADETVRRRQSWPRARRKAGRGQTDREDFARERRRREGGKRDGGIDNIGQSSTARCHELWRCATSGT